MLKKYFFFIFITFSLLFISTSVFANNIGTDAVNTVRSVIGGAENVVEDGVTTITNSVRDGMNTMTNNDNNNNMTNTNNYMSTDRNNADYSATRTATTNAITSTGTDLWTWMILAVLGIVIIALVWYYTTQNSNRVHNED